MLLLCTTLIQTNFKPTTQKNITKCVWLTYSISKTKQRSEHIFLSHRCIHVFNNIKLITNEMSKTMLRVCHMAHVRASYVMLIFANM